jgi:hypothetical protein
MDSGDSTIGGISAAGFALGFFVGIFVGTLAINKCLRLCHQTGWNFNRLPVSMVAKAVTIGRRATGLVQNGMVAAGATEIFLKYQTGEILQSVRGHVDVLWAACQIRFFVRFPFSRVL